MIPRLAPVLLAVLATFACSRPESSSTGSSLASTISTADPVTAAQLIRGFYDLDHNAWRWTQKNFSVTLGAPRGSAQKGAVLALRFTLPQVLLQNLKFVTISAAITGFKLPVQGFSKTGENIYRQDVPAQAFHDNSVQVDFFLDKTLPPSAADSRDLGIIVSEIGLEAK